MFPLSFRYLTTGDFTAVISSAFFRSSGLRTKPATPVNSISWESLNSGVENKPATKAGVMGHLRCLGVALHASQVDAKSSSPRSASSVYASCPLKQSPPPPPPPTASVPALPVECVPYYLETTVIVVLFAPE